MTISGPQHELILTAKTIVGQGDGVTYPSRGSAQYVRKVMADLVTAAEHLISVTSEMAAEIDRLKAVPRLVNVDIDIQAMVKTAVDEALKKKLIAVERTVDDAAT